VAEPEHGGYPAGDATVGELLTAAQEAEWRQRLTAALQGQPTVLPPRFLTADKVAQLLGECVTVVKPGETLVLRMGNQWTPSQVREVQDMLDAAIKERGLSFTAIVAHADGLGVVQAGTDAAFADRVAQANADLAMRRRFPLRRPRGR
jgi:hypothetical protein